MVPPGEPCLLGAGPALQVTGLASHHLLPENTPVDTSMLGMVAFIYTDCHCLTILPLPRPHSLLLSIRAETCPVVGSLKHHVHGGSFVNNNNRRRRSHGVAFVCTWYIRRLRQLWLLLHRFYEYYIDPIYLSSPPTPLLYCNPMLNSHHVHKYIFETESSGDRNA